MTDKFTVYSISPLDSKVPKTKLIPSGDNLPACVKG